MKDKGDMKLNLLLHDLGPHTVKYKHPMYSTVYEPDQNK